MSSNDPTNDLVNWLRAELDTDERLAQQASPGPWVDSIGDVREGDLACNWVANAGVTDRAHIAQHDPTRVLREVEAKRAIVDLCARNLEFEDYGWSVSVPVLRHLAAAYSDRPGYREEWASA